MIWSRRINMIDKLNEFLEKGADQFYDDNYEVDIHVYRKHGMKSSKITIEGDKPSILTGIASLLEALICNNIADEKLLHDTVDMVVKAVRSYEK